MDVEKEILVKMLLGMPCDHCIYESGNDCVDCKKGVEAWVEENLMKNDERGERKDESER